MPATRPLTVREIQDQKRKLREAEQNKVTVKNLSSFQAIPIQIYGKNSKLAIHQITISIPPNKSVSLPSHRLIDAQINNLRKRGLISCNKSGVKGPTDYRQFLDPAFMKKKDESKSVKSSKGKSKPK